MQPHRWIEFRGKKKIAVFIVVTLVALAFISQLPKEAWRMRGTGRASFFPPLPIGGIVLWIGGWFAALFLRAQDLNLMFDYNYQRIYRWGGIAAAAAGFFLAVILTLRFLIS